MNCKSLAAASRSPRSSRDADILVSRIFFFHLEYNMILNCNVSILFLFFSRGEAGLPVVLPFNIASKT